MDGSVTHEEFQRMQNHILDLRTANYELKEELKRAVNEKDRLSDNVKKLETDNSRYKLQGSFLQQLGGRNSKKESAILIQENEFLQQKMQQQEESFQMQLQIMNDELSKLREENTSLLKKTDKTEQNSSNDAEIRRLLAENAVLKKQIDVINNHESNSHPLDDSETLISATLSEEKRLLSEQLQDLEISFKDVQQKLSDETGKVASLSEKLKKKQSSFVSLQEEKEHLYLDNERLQAEIKEAKIQECTEIQELKQELKDARKQFEEVNGKNLELQTVVDALREQIDARNIEYLEEVNAMKRKSSDRDEMQKSLESEKSSLQKIIKDLKEEIGRFVSDNDALESHNTELADTSENLRTQLLEKESEIEKLNDSLFHIQAKVSESEGRAVVAEKLAEKRKAMMDDVNTESQRLLQSFQSERDVLLAKYNATVSKCNDLTSSLEENNQELAVKTKKLEDLARELENESQHKEELVVSLDACSKIRDELESQLANQIQSLKNQHSESLNAHVEKIKLVEQSLSEKSLLLEKSQERIIELEQDVLDKIEERKIAERKIVAKHRDIQKQAKLEKAKADRLEQKLQEILSNEKLPSGYDDSYLSVRSPANVDSMSVSSFGGNNPLTPPPSESLSSDETSGLLQRITHLQEEKWLLEEKVSHLETSCAGLTEDVLAKERIIQSYLVQKGHIEKFSQPKPPEERSFKHRFKDFVNNEANQMSSRDMEKRLQNMLEETLTRNLQLENDLDLVTKELAKYTKADPHS